MQMVTFSALLDFSQQAFEIVAELSALIVGVMLINSHVLNCQKEQITGGVGQLFGEDRSGKVAVMDLQLRELHQSHLAYKGGKPLPSTGK
jgi:hypothetical protein